MALGSIPRSRLPRDRRLDGHRIVGAAAAVRGGHAARGLPRREGREELLRGDGVPGAWERARRARQRERRRLGGGAGGAGWGRGGGGGGGGRTDPCPRRASSCTAGSRGSDSDGSFGRRQIGSGYGGRRTTCPTVRSKYSLKAPTRRSSSSNLHSGGVPRWHRSPVWKNTMFHMIRRCRSDSKSTD